MRIIQKPLKLQACIPLIVRSVLSLDMSRSVHQLELAFVIRALIVRTNLAEPNFNATWCQPKNDRLQWIASSLREIKCGNVWTSEKNFLNYFAKNNSSWLTEWLTVSGKFKFRRKNGNAFFQLMFLSHFVEWDSDRCKCKLFIFISDF